MDKLLIESDAVIEAERIIEGSLSRWGVYEILAFLIKHPVAECEVIQQNHVPENWAWVRYSPYGGIDPVVMVPLEYYGPEFMEYYGRLLRHLIDYQHTGRTWFEKGVRFLDDFEQYLGEHVWPFDVQLLLSKLRQWIARPYLPDEIVKNNKNRSR